MDTLRYLGDGFWGVDFPDRKVSARRSVMLDILAESYHWEDSGDWPKGTVNRLILDIRKA